MFNTATLIIPVIFMLISAILMWSTSYFKERMWTKLLLTVVLFSLCLAAWTSVESYAGWPSGNIREMDFQVLQVVIDEPDKKNGTPGYIYVWLRTSDIQQDMLLDFLGYRANENEPYAVRLPYTRESHKQAQQMREMLKGDKNVEGKFEKSLDGIAGNVYNLKTIQDKVKHDLPGQNIRNKPPSRP